MLVALKVVRCRDVSSSFIRTCIARTFTSRDEPRRRPGMETSCNEPKAHYPSSSSTSTTLGRPGISYDLSNKIVTFFNNYTIPQYSNINRATILYSNLDCNFILQLQKQESVDFSYKLIKINPYAIFYFILNIKIIIQIKQKRLLSGN